MNVSEDAKLVQENILWEDKIGDGDQLDWGHLKNKK